MRNTKMKPPNEAGIHVAEKSAISLDHLSAENAMVIGAGVGHLLKGGMSPDLAIGVTARLAEFVGRGMKAQQAVDLIIADYNARQKS